MSAPNISYFKFADERLGYGHTVRDMTEEELQSEFKYLEKCLDPKRVGGSGGCDDSIWRDGCYRRAGYQFSFEDLATVLVRHDYDKFWCPRYVPRKDDDLARAYIREFEHDAKYWIWLEDDAIHEVEEE